MYALISVHSSVPYEVFTNLDFHSFINLHDLVAGELASRDLETRYIMALAFGGSERQVNEWASKKQEIIDPHAEPPPDDNVKNLQRELGNKVVVQ